MSHKESVPHHLHFTTIGHVILYTGIDFMAASKDGYGDLQEKIKTYLERELAPNYTHRDDTKVAIKFRYTLPETGYLDVDLLLSPHWKDEESYYADLAQIKPPIKRLMYVITTRLITLVLYTCCPFRFSVSTSKYQTDFIKGHPQRNHVRRPFSQNWLPQSFMPRKIGNY